MSNYAKKPKYLDELVKVGTALGAGLHHFAVLHDDWCALLKGTGACNCNPEVRSIDPPRTDR